MRRSIEAHIDQGETGYVAECVDVPVVTQGRTIQEAMEDLREAVGLFIEGEDLGQYGLAPDPSLLVTVEIKISAHAG
jgi:predicted RNase H-like HicB family nuclease